MADSRSASSDYAFGQGKLVGGKYRVSHRIGSGAMGIVVAARHVELEEDVALKILNPELKSNKEALARFTREARAMFALKGEHVGRVFDVGKLDSGEPFIVMELLAGQTLKELLDATPRPPLDASLVLMSQICEAVGEAHAAGIVHRDLKPENIFVLTREGGLHAKVIDFGVSKARFGGAEHTLTQADALLGTPRYMAPEQFKSSQSADARSDVWSLGIMFYRMITGRFPFEASTVTELVAAIEKKRPRPPNELQPDVTTTMSAIAMRCLAPRPDDRYADARDLRSAFAAISPTLAAPPPPPPSSSNDATVNMPAPVAISVPLGAPASEIMPETLAPPTEEPDTSPAMTRRGMPIDATIDEATTPAKRPPVEETITAQAVTHRTQPPRTVPTPMHAPQVVPDDAATMQREAIAEKTRVVVPMMPIAQAVRSSPALGADATTFRAAPPTETKQGPDWSGIATVVALGLVAALLSFVVYVRAHRNARAAELQAIAPTTSYVVMPTATPTSTSTSTSPPTSPSTPTPTPTPTPTSTSTSTPTSTSAPTAVAPRNTGGKSPRPPRDPGSHGPNDKGW